MTNMAFKIVGTLHVICLGPKDPTQEDWNEYVRAIQTEERKGIDVAQMCTCVFSDGGGPNAAQRKQVNDLLHGRTTKLSVVTTSSALRGIMTAMSWFNPQAKAFAPDEAGEALTHLGVPTAKFDSIKQMGQELLQSLGLKQVKALEQAALTKASAARARP